MVDQEGQVEGRGIASPTAPHAGSMELNAAQAADAGAVRCRIAVGYAISGDLRFISHHDTLRLFKRALARAGLAVRYSQGFNPQPKIMIPLPRPVGVASTDETVVIAFDRTVDPSNVVAELGAEMPDGMRLQGARALQPREKLDPEAVDYRIALDRASDDGLAQRVEALLACESACVDRAIPSSHGTRSIDVRPYLLALCATPDGVDVTLSVTPTGTARPSEVAILLGIGDAPINHLILRTRVHWRDQPHC